MYYNHSGNLVEKGITYPQDERVITRANAETVNRFVKNVHGKPIIVRRNGKTKTWKRKPNEFSIPVKWGLYTCFYITNLNGHEWLQS